MQFNTSKILHFGCLIYLKFSYNESKQYTTYSEGYNKIKLRMTTEDYLDNTGSSNLGLFQLLPGFFSNEFEKL